eukprot:SAG11_NODE_849_length_6877_cov_15.646946_4_plen_110_part_00
MCGTSVGIFHRKIDLAPDVGGTEVPATMAGKVRNLGPIIPDFVYGSSSDGVPLENQGRMGGQSQRLLPVENETRPAFAPEQAKRSGVGLHSAPQAIFHISPVLNRSKFK